MVYNMLVHLYLGVFYFVFRVFPCKNRNYFGIMNSLGYEEKKCYFCSEKD